ncbi:MAG: helix-turn-helix domain-containing protein [Bacteroidota bacterium]
MNFWEILLLFFSFQALLLSIFLIIKKSLNKKANLIFALFLFLFSYTIFFYVLFWTEFSTSLYVDLHITDDIPFTLFGPLFYFYIAKTVAQKRFSWKDLLHGIPLVLSIYQCLPFYLLSREEKVEVIKNGVYSDYVNAIPHFSFFLAILVILYGVFTFFRFVKYFKADAEMKSWLTAISATYVTFAIANIAYYVLTYTSLMQPNYDYFITYAMVFFVGLTAYFGFMHPTIFNGTPIHKVIPFIKYEKTGLSDDFSREMKNRLMNIMTSDKPYLNPDIRLDNLAGLIDVSRHHASQIINEHFSMNFFDFVNSYRIQEAKELLLNSKNPDLTISDIAYQCGFNNRISFYKAFRKVEGVTPSEYRRGQLIS